MPMLSIVVPVYNEEECLPSFFEQVRPPLEQVTDDYEIIFAVDPCSDRTEEIIAAEHAKDSRIKMLRFSRRFGHPASIWGGLAFSKGDAVICLDCDLQDPPELIPELVRIWKEEGYKMVIPQRRTRAGENPIKKAVSWLAYWFINKIASINIPRNAGEFRLMDRVVVNELMRLHECNCFLRGLASVVGFKTKFLPFDRKARVAGTTKFHMFIGNIYDGFNGVVAFSGILLRIMGLAGVALAGLSMLGALGIILVKVTGLRDFALGIPTLAVLLLFLTGCQFMGLGILGAYVGRIYDEVKERPRFIVEYGLGYTREELDSSPRGQRHEY